MFTITQMLFGSVSEWRLRSKAFARVEDDVGPAGELCVALPLVGADDVVVVA
ncbi:MAG TPA: hypothetical protein VHW64_02045 [Nocardioides sp.]|nr:hypothetical protein [Nocardioides sp.]